MGGRAVTGRRLAALAVALPWLPGCSSPIYQWGPYEDSVARMYQPGGVDPAAEAAAIGEHIERTVSRGKLVPPGMRAHYGMLLIETGNAERGTAALRAEKEAFPESAAFIDGVIARMGASR